MKKKLILLFFFGAFLFSCSTKTDYPYVDISRSIPLSDPIKLFRFDNKVPVDIAVKDSLAVLLFYKEDTCGVVYNLNTQKPINHFGVVGDGPGEVTGLDFITNKQYAMNRDSIYFFDINQGKILGASLKTQENHFTLNLMDSPNAMYASSNQNISGNLFVGRIMKGNDNMFSIYHKETQTMHTIDYFPKISNIDARAKKNYFVSHLALNEKKEKVIAGMYFMDLIHIYNIQGKREKTICFSKQWMPPVKKHRLDLSEGYSGTNGIYPTENYCYVKRWQISISKHNKQSKKTINTYLLQLDWDGNLIKSYSLTGDFEPGFCVDEKNNRIYAIQTNIEADNAEYYDVVYYDLD